MEVLFAIAVLTIGLLGVASILPVATNNASMVLQTDRAVEEINNRIATDLAQLTGAFEDVNVANNSATNFAATSLRVDEVDTARFGTYLAGYEKLLPNGDVNQPSLPEAFCIDPWFLSAAGTLRDDSTSNTDDRNGYDRTMFPCYDPRLHPISQSPTDEIAQSLGGGLTKVVNSPRFTRIGLSPENSNLISAMNAQAEARPSDDFSLVSPKDSTFGPGLFIQRSGNGALSPAKETVSSRFSSFVMMARSSVGSSIFNTAVVTMLDRNIVTVPGGEYNGHIVLPAGQVAAHNMRPYTAWLPDDPAFPGSFPKDADQIYPDEMLGYVTYAPRPLSGGGGGEFQFRTNRHVRPSVSSGDWLLLMRREYTRAPGSPIVPGALKYAWYRVTSVSKPPTLGPGTPATYYETQVTVRGPDWLFHPIQNLIFGNAGPPYFGGPTAPTWGSPPAYSYDAMPAQGVNPTGYNHFDYGTVVVLMPNVISVKQFQTQL
ncbi:hypothetical protein NHH03_18015 [Stieleria sp. TO1_6]|uniref:PulJ/GspJ family protein n=1 Tax=Stieleria tagensis TaxID=2956795 RepID=UPI00209BB878|nr:hypothetical protein [Stieleria tagensis]MCO8123647.1 hypothetical protein [Stieleria tagensis]